MVDSSAGMQAWRTFLEAHAAISKQLERELREQSDFPLSWYDALVQLHEVGGTMRMHELADRLLLSRSATTRFADRLERAGLISRATLRTDRRGTEISLTAKGLDELKRTSPVHLRGIAEHFTEQFNDDELSVIAGLFQRLAPTRAGLSDSSVS